MVPNDILRGEGATLLCPIFLREANHTELAWWTLTSHFFTKQSVPPEPLSPSCLQNYIFQKHTPSAFFVCVCAVWGFIRVGCGRKVGPAACNIDSLQLCYILDMTLLERGGGRLFGGAISLLRSRTVALCRFFSCFVVGEPFWLVPGSLQVDTVQSPPASPPRLFMNCLIIHPQMLTLLLLRTLNTPTNSLSTQATTNHAFPRHLRPGPCPLNHAVCRSVHGTF